MIQFPDGVAEISKTMKERQKQIGRIFQNKKQTSSSQATQIDMLDSLEQAALKEPISFDELHLSQFLEEYLDIVVESSWSQFK